METKMVPVQKCKSCVTFHAPMHTNLYRAWMSRTSKHFFHCQSSCQPSSLSQICGLQTHVVPHRFLPAASSCKGIRKWTRSGFYRERKTFLLFGLNVCSAIMRICALLAHGSCVTLGKPLNASDLASTCWTNLKHTERF